MNWLHYLAEANLYLGVFYLAYGLLLNRGTHYQLRRAYLIFSCTAAFALPVLQVGALKTVKPAKMPGGVAYGQVSHTAMANDAPVVTIHNHSAVQNVAAAPAAQRRLSEGDYLWYAYLAGAGILLLVFLVKLCAMYRLSRGQECADEGRYRVVRLAGKNVAFSFFNYLFIGGDTFGTDTIIRHELVHIRQRHSLDIVFLELLKIINWFNPLVYLLQNSLRTVHEYIADEQAAAHETDALAYSSFLLANAYGADGSALTNAFFNHNLLKKRIIMLNQQRSGNLARLKYLVAFPICGALLCASTLAFSKTYGWIDLAPAKAAAVKDSSRLTTMDGKPILPVINVDGYYPLDHFLHQRINYSSAKGDRGGLVEVGFSLDNDQHIINAHIVKSGGVKLDALALDGFNAYKGAVNDDPGKTYKIGVYFFTGDYAIFKTDSLQKDPEFAGELIIPNYKYPTMVTSKGYEYDESGIGLPGNGSDMRNAKVVIYDENGNAHWYYHNKCTPADLRLLKDKYGYTFPSGTAETIQFMHSKDAGNSRLAYVFNAASYLDAPYAGNFYQYMANNIVYPAQAKKALAGGVVVLNFTLDNDGLIKDVKVAQGAGKGFDDAAVNALQSYKTVISDKKGPHSIAIVFCVAEKKYRPAVSGKFRKAGYVGELAVSDGKSPFAEAAR